MNRNSVHKNDIKSQAKKYPVLVNRKRVVATAEDKANITNFRFTRPKVIPDGFVERRNSKGELLDYKLIEPITFQDVDGRVKHTIKTAYYEVDKRTLKDKPKRSVGEYDEYLAGAYHGKLSRNWKPTQLTLSEIISELNAGYGITPGLFNNPPDKSFRSKEHHVSSVFMLFDGDAWTPEHPPPTNLDDFIKRYPDLLTDFFWIGESINSRTQLKPELRTRLMLLLPEEIYRENEVLWQTVINAFVEKYPFIDKNVGNDEVRLSFGNARPESENRILGGFVSHETFTQWKQTARKKETEAERARVETEKQKAENAKRKAEKKAVTTELKRRGHAIAENKDPLHEYCEVNPETLLIENGLASHLSGNTWNWYESSQGRSFELVESPHVKWALKIFSSTMQGSHPDADSTKPVNAHRFILYHQHRLDISKDADKHGLRCILADAGYGTHPDDYKKAKRGEKVAGVREGLVSPLELRRPEPPLPTEPVERVMRTLDENEPEIRKAFEHGARVVAIRAGTGDGKTEVVIIIAKDGRHVALTVPSLPVAEQIHNRFLDANCGAMLWHQRFHGYNEKYEENDTRITPDAPFEERVRAFHKGEVVCVDPVKCKASQERGIPAPVGVCANCPLQADCGNTGYLSQIPAAQNSHVLTLAYPKLFIDPAFAGFFSQLSKGQPKERLHVIDEAKAHDLFIDCELHKEQLQQWVKDWQGEKLGMFAEAVLTLLEVETADPYEIAKAVNALDDDDLSTLGWQASRFRVGYNRSEQIKLDPDTDGVLARHGVQFESQGFAFIAVDFDAYERLLELGEPVMQPSEIQDTGHMALTPSQAFRFDVYRNETPDDFREIPRIYESELWTCFQQLKVFAERYQRREDAPIWYQLGVLHWVNAPVLHSRVKHLVCMSATLQREGFKRAFDSLPSEQVAFIETPPTHWVDGHRAFQVRSGKYSRATILEREHGTFGKIKGLSDTGKRFISLIETELKRDRKKKHVIITINAIVDMHRAELLKKHANLIDVHSFHKMEGLDYKESGLVFWVIGCPDVELDVVRNQAKVIYGNDTELLNYEYDDETGTYVDERLQRCWQALVADLLKQAVGRARLNRLANTVFVFSNVLISDYTGRAVGFVPEDLEVAAGLDTLSTVAKRRIESEKEATENPKQTARQREKEARNLKAEKKTEVYRLYNAGMSKTGIKERTGISRPTIDKYLKEAPF